VHILKKCDYFTDKYRLNFIETSALDNVNIEKTFNEIISGILKFNLNIYYN
jgi:hypothetical protein